jgi:ribosomal protein L7/L12
MSIPEFIFTFVMVANVIATFFSNAQRLRDVERKLNLLLSHLDIDPTSQVSPSSHVISLAADPKQRMAAIKAYRRETGAGLKDAAAAIDQLQVGSPGRAHKNGFE